MGISTLISFLPLREDLWLGLSGDPVFVLLAPFLMFISTGFVVVLWWFLQLLMLPLNLISRCRGSRCVYPKTYACKWF